MRTEIEVPPAPSLVGCRTRVRVDAFRYRRGQIAADGSVLLRWYADKKGVLWEVWAPDMAAVERIKAYNRWQRKYTAAGRRAREKAAGMREARKWGSPEDEVRARFMVGRVEVRPKTADPSIYPTGRAAMANPSVVVPQVGVKFGKRASDKRWLLDLVFAPTWAFFLKARKRPGLTQDEYAELCEAVRPHAEAALARWHAEEVAVGYRGLRQGWKGTKRRQRVFAPGSVGTLPRDMWPPAPPRTQKRRGDTARDEETTDGSGGSAPADA